MSSVAFSHSETKAGRGTKARHCPAALLKPWACVVKTFSHCVCKAGGGGGGGGGSLTAYTLQLTC